MYGPNRIGAGFRTGIITIIISQLSLRVGRKRIGSSRNVVSEELLEIAVVGAGEAL